MSRPLHEIALDVFRTWKNPSVHAFPYLEAMRKLDKVGDMYGCEYGDMIVAYFLSNAVHWRGSDARRVKKELKQMLDDYNEGR